MTIGPPPSCYTCKHVHEGTLLSPRPKCEAYPKGIPKPIIEGENSHEQPYQGDHGIQYERKAEA